MAQVPDVEEFWRGFSRDPRDPAVAALRVSDRDRAHLTGALADAYADGRLDPAEHDQRVDAANAVRTFAQVPDVVADLVPTTALPVRSEPQDLRARAEEHWRREMRSALATFGGLSVLLVGIWLLTSIAGGFYFFWPAFPIFFTGLHAGQTFFKRDEIIAKRERKLERREERDRRRLDPDTRDTPDPPDTPDTPS